MRAAVCLVLACLGLGCASKASEPPFGQAAPTHCNKTDRHGAYLLEFTTESGNCGMQASGLINLDDPMGGAGCVNSGTTLSNGDCKLTTTVRCPATASAAASEATMVLTQETQDGSILDGTMTIQVSGSSGCIGTYAFRGTRQ